jgi:hypothetical protein
MRGSDLGPQGSAIVVKSSSRQKQQQQKKKQQQQKQKQQQEKQQQKQPGSISDSQLGSQPRVTHIANADGLSL